MGTLVKNELFKLRKKSTTIVMPLIMIGLMILVTVLTASAGDITSYADIMAAGSAWLVITLISAAGSILSMEYEYGTIKELFSSKFSRSKILMSKWLAIFVYSILLNVLMIASTFIIYFIGRATTSKFIFNWSDKMQNMGDVTVVENLVKSCAGLFLQTWLLLSVVFLVASVIKKSSLAVTLGIVVYFASSMISGILMSLMITFKLDWLKYSPFNMLLVNNLGLPHDNLLNVAHLDAISLVSGALIYTVIFLIIGLLFYRRKEV
ncbi:ABC transporter permease [Holzapfeliella sp. JNUCC 72]